MTEVNIQKHYFCDEQIKIIILKEIGSSVKPNSPGPPTDESSVTFQLSVSGPGEFGHKMVGNILRHSFSCHSFFL